MTSRALWPLVALALVLPGCNGGGDKSASTGTTDTGTPAKEDGGAPKATPAFTKLGTEDLVVGKGPVAADGDLLAMDYTGTLTNGKKFDSSKDRGEPLALVLGSGMVIKGWDQGIKGMRVGGKRKLSIPAELGYGSRSQGDAIPPNSDLIFEVELLDIVKKGEEDVVERKDVKTGTGPAVKDGDTVTIHYVGTLANGKEFDSSRASGRPFSFKVGQGDVVSGFDAAVTGMKKGGVRQVKLPPATAYGQQPPAGIPANAILRFEIELLGVK